MDTSTNQPKCPQRMEQGGPSVTGLHVCLDDLQVFLKLFSFLPKVLNMTEQKRHQRKKPFPEYRRPENLLCFSDSVGIYQTPPIMSLKRHNVTAVGPGQHKQLEAKGLAALTRPLMGPLRPAGSPRLWGE